MKFNELIEIEKKREYKVSKSNEIIQRSRYQLSLQEQRAIAYICSMIKPRTALENAIDQPFQLEYEFNILDYARTCGIEKKGTFYEDTRELLKGLIQKVMFLQLPDGTEVSVNWVNKVWTNKRSGKAKIRLDEDLAPYLFNLQERFTSYQLINVLAFKSQYSYRLYELLKSYKIQKTKNFTIDEFKKMLMVENVKSYTNFKDLRRFVIEPAISEINKYTDISVSYKTITKGRKVIEIEFQMQDKDTTTRIECMWNAHLEVEK